MRAKWGWLRFWFTLMSPKIWGFGQSRMFLVFSQILSFDFSICVRAFLSLFGLPVALTQFVYLLKLLLWVSRDRVSTSLSSPNSISSIYSHFLASAHSTSIIIYRFQLNLSNIYIYIFYSALLGSPVGQCYNLAFDPMHDSWRLRFHRILSKMCSTSNEENWN